MLMKFCPVLGLMNGGFVDSFLPLLREIRRQFKGYRLKERLREITIGINWEAFDANLYCSWHLNLAATKHGSGCF